jgi:endonuclease/exonuclease/phosphatase (EEP) superfamily protein YafD
LAIVWFLPLLLCIPLALLTRSGGMCIAIAAAIGSFLLLFGHAWTVSPPNPGRGMPLRVATFNHRFDNDNIPGILAAIRAQDADIIALQELSVPVAAALQHDLSSVYPYQWLSPAPDASGLGLLSRYPLLTTQPEPTFRGQRVTLSIHGRALTVINVHPNTPFPKTQHETLGQLVATAQQYDQGGRSEQLARLLQQVTQVAGPIIVLGDFNTSDREPSYAALAASMQDAYRTTTAGFGFTYPTQVGAFALPVMVPLIRIDYVWSAGGVVPISTQVDCHNGGSDHCLLIATLNIP